MSSTSRCGRWARRDESCRPPVVIDSRPSSKMVAARCRSKVVADPEEKPMAPDRLSSLVGLSAASLAIALALPPTASADPPSWNGEYAITFIVGPKSGTSMAASDPEGQYTDTYAFSSSCTSGKCTATIVGGPAPRNPTVPQPVQFTWMGRPGRRPAISNGTARCPTTRSNGIRPEPTCATRPNPTGHFPAPCTPRS